MTALGSDPAAQGLEYERLRARLHALFYWKGMVNADELTDETLSRVARKLTQGEQVRSMTSYVLGVARFVYLEAVKQQAKQSQAHQRAAITHEPDDAADDTDRLAALRHCLTTLNQTERTIVEQYYLTEHAKRIPTRRELAKKHGISINSLRIRAHRARKKLENCVRHKLVSRNESGTSATKSTHDV